MNILYFGAFCPSSLLKDHPRSGLDTYRVCEFFIQGFRSINDLNLNVISAINVCEYPKFPKFNFNRCVDESGIIYIGFINISIVKQLMQVINGYRDACRIIKRNMDSTTYVIFPFVAFHFALLSRLLKLRFRNQIIVCNMVPDIFFPKQKVKQLLNKRSENWVSKGDAFVLFTKDMAMHLDIQEAKSLVMEGIIMDFIQSFKSTNQAKEERHKLRVVYTGALRQTYGVEKLIDMMRILKRDDFELYVSGWPGRMEKCLKEAANRDTRIHFLGTIPKEEVFNLQSDADVLINPRSDNDAPKVTKYIFPSKLLEYMITGNVTLTCRMKGIPDEYYNYVYIAEDDTPTGLANALDKILNLSVEER